MRAAYLFILTIGLLLISPLSAPFAQAESWFALCRGEAASSTTPPAALSYSYALGNGEPLTLALYSAKPALSSGCNATSLPLAASAISGMQLLPADGEMPNALLLEEDAGNVSSKKPGIPLQLSPILPEAAVSLPLLLGENMLGTLQPAIFGPEEVTALGSPTSGNNVQLSCKAHNGAHGIVIRGTGNYRLPAAPSLHLRLRYQSNAPFTLGISDKARQLSENPSILGVLPNTSKETEIVFSLPSQGFDYGAAPSFTLLCPDNGGAITLSSLTPIADAKAKPALSAWVWEPEKWQKNGGTALLNALSRQHIAAIFITVPVVGNEVAHRQELAEFIRKAHSRHIQIWAVEGAPEAVLPEGRKEFTHNAAAFSRYNRAVPEESRLSGVQYDIEPYTAAGYALDKTAWQLAYVETLAALRQALEMPLEAVLPFWIEEKVMAQIVPHVNGIAVMDYRTNAAEITGLAERFLSWGEANRKYVRIGLEAGKLPASRQTVYRPLTAGTLWLLPLEPYRVALLLQNPMANPYGPAYGKAQFSVNNQGGTSFQGDIPRLQGVVSTVTPQLLPWSSFAGIALHGVF